MSGSILSLSQPVSSARPLPSAEAPGDGAGEPVALLQLAIGDRPGAVAEAASAVYREVRRGRRVVATAAGPDASARLVQALDAIGVEAALPGPDSAFLVRQVSVVPGPEAARAAAPPSVARPLRVAVAGFGVVGGGVAPRIAADPRFDLVGVLVRDPGKRRDPTIPRRLLVADGAALLAREPDVLVEAISDACTARALIRAALARGIHVVSASKQAIAADCSGLTALAQAGGARLAWSAAVGGGAPMVETVRRARAHGPVRSIEGVLNGTSNFILNARADGAGFEAALARARDAGFAEADPSADLEGRDAAAKLSLLAQAAGLSLALEAVTREVLGPQSGGDGPLRQIARFDAASGTAEVRLRPAGSDALFADLPGEAGALRVVTEDGRVFSCRGRGAGRIPTAESVWADLIDLTEA